MVRHCEPTGTILDILYSEVPHKLPAKYQPNRPGGWLVGWLVA